MATMGYDATVKLRDGRTLCAPIWEWRPVAGWMSLVGQTGEPVYLRDVVEAHVMQWLHAAMPPERVDLLERARREGWDGR